MLTLASALAARVNRVLPDGFQASATGTIVSLSTPMEKDLRDIDISLVLNHVDNLSVAAEAATSRRECSSADADRVAEEDLGPVDGGVIGGQLATIPALDVQYSVRA
ncbi:MAG: hypothetical protein ACRDQU_12655 [Pseudonocardiaceae bacterium]